MVGAGNPAGLANTGPHLSLRRGSRPLTLSGAEVMPGPVAVLWLFIMIGPLSVLSVGAAQFRREEGTFNTTPDASVSAPSRFACSAKCASMLPCFCHGFTYHEDGTCDLYRGDKSCQKLQMDCQQDLPETSIDAPGDLPETTIDASGDVPETSIDASGDLPETTTTPSGAPGTSGYRLLPREMCPGELTSLGCEFDLANYLANSIPNQD